MIRKDRMKVISMSAIKIFAFCLLSMLMCLEGHDFAKADDIKLKSSYSNQDQIVPFVGCAETWPDHSKAPIGAPVSVSLPPAVAQALAVYSSEHAAIFAPRGWDCYGILGPSYIALIVHPKSEIPSVGLDVPLPRGAYGEVIYYNPNDGVVSEENTVLYAHMYFPSTVSDRYAQGWLQKNGVPAFIMTKYHTDILKIVDQKHLLYRTPKFKAGIGLDIFQSGMFPIYPKKADIDTYGFINLYSTSSMVACRLYMFSARLPENYAKLSDYISFLTSKVADKGGQNACRQN